MPEVKIKKFIVSPYRGEGHLLVYWQCIHWCFAELLVYPQRKDEGVHHWHLWSGELLSFHWQCSAVLPGRSCQVQPQYLLVKGKGCLHFHSPAADTSSRQTLWLPRPASDPPFHCGKQVWRLPWWWFVLYNCNSWKKSDKISLYCSNARIWR